MDCRLSNAQMAEHGTPNQPALYMVGLSVNSDGYLLRNIYINPVSNYRPVVVHGLRHERGMICGLLISNLPIILIFKYIILRTS